MDTKQFETLIIIDVQNGFVNTPKGKDITSKIAQLLKFHPFNTVIATKFINSPDNPLSKLMGWTGMTSYEEQCLAPEIKLFVDIEVEKHTYSCVSDEFLERLKKSNFGKLPEKVFIVGCDTDACVLHSAIDLFEQGIEPYILMDYCFSSNGKEANDAGGTVLKNSIGEKFLIYGPICRNIITDPLLKNAKDNCELIKD